MAAFKLKLEIDQGATFDKTVTWKTGDPATPVNLTGCIARSHFRSALESPDILMELTTANNRIQLGGTAGTIRLRIEATDTAAITWDSAVYDLEIEFPDGTVERKLKGTVTVSKEITR